MQRLRIYFVFYFFFYLSFLRCVDADAIVCVDSDCFAFRRWLPFIVLMVCLSGAAVFCTLGLIYNTNLSNTLRGTQNNSFINVLSTLLQNSINKVNQIIGNHLVAVVAVVFVLAFIVVWHFGWLNVRSSFVFCLAAPVNFISSNLPGTIST